MDHRVALAAIMIGMVVIVGWSTWSEAHRSGCHRWNTCPPHHREFLGQVVKVKDGDTIEVQDDGSTTTIHLAGVDAPEMRQALGGEATRFTADLLFG